MKEKSDRYPGEDISITKKEADREQLVRQRLMVLRVLAKIGAIWAAGERK